MPENNDIINSTDGIVDTILQGNNNFVSTLDHLPCDITRCLWLIQMMNLRNVRLQKQLALLISKSSNINDSGSVKEISRLKNMILRNSSEAECESKYALSILNNHVNILDDDREILSILKSKLAGWTSEAVERRWNEWGVFKRQVIDDLNIEDEDENVNNNAFQINLQSVDNITKSKVKSSSPNAGLKIKLKLKSAKIDSKRKKLNGVLQQTPKIISKNNIHKKVGKIPNKNIVRKKSFAKSEDNVAVDKIPKVESTVISEPEPVPAPVTLREVEEHYCFCGGPSFGRMVACENEKCPHEWFHFKCVGLHSEPEGEWFCSKSCEEQHNIKLQRKMKMKKRRKW